MQKRGVAFVGVMSLITLGIYILYWLYKTKQELIAKKADVPRMSLLLYPLFIFVVWFLINMLVMMGSDGNNFMFIGFLSMALFLLLIPATIAIWVFWFYKYCKAVEKVSKRKISFEYSFLLCLVLGFFNLPFIWTALMQYEFNKLK